MRAFVQACVKETKPLLSAGEAPPFSVGFSPHCSGEFEGDLTMRLNKNSLSKINIGEFTAFSCFTLPGLGKEWAGW